MSTCTSAVITKNPDWFELALEELSVFTGCRLKNYDDLTKLGAVIPDAAVHMQLGDPESIWISATGSSRLEHAQGADIARDVGQTPEGLDREQSPARQGL
jgi:hypothetical protein